MPALSANCIRAHIIYSNYCPKISYANLFEKMEDINYADSDEITPESIIRLYTVCYHHVCGETNT